MSRANNITNISSRKLHPYVVPSWGVEVLIRAWTVAERADFFKIIDQATETKDFAALVKVAITCLAEDDGKLCFTEEDIPALMLKEFNAFHDICREAMRINGILKDDIEKKETE